MIYRLTLRNCFLSDLDHKYIDFQVEKIAKLLPTFTNDLPLLVLNIEGFNKKCDFQGTVALHLPQKTLYAEFESPLVKNALKLGFLKIRRELKNYKARHFVGSSEYPRHRESFRMA